jgi:hypothetical protein
VDLAHGLGGVSDLPIPVWMAMYGAAGALLFSFLALGALWHRPRLDGPGGHPLPGACQRLLSSSGALAAVRVLGLALFVLVLAAAWFGAADVQRNPAPAWLYVWLWVGVVPASLLLGPVVRALSPLRTLAAGVQWLLPDGGRRDYPATWGYWPAVASLLTFLWLELVYDRAAEPITVAVYLTTYAVVHVALGAVFGSDWFSHAEGFEVYSTLMGRMSPLAHDDGAWRWRNPMRGLARIPPTAGIVAVVVTMLGSTAFDGLSRTLWWQNLVQSSGRVGYLAWGTAGLVVAIGLVAGLYLAAIAITRSFATEHTSLAERFVHSLVPIMIGYTVAHYFSFALFDGQRGYLLGTDPFARGWDLFGVAGQAVNFTLVSTTTIAVVQVLAIVVGHILGVVAAHDRALSTFAEERQRIAEYPLLAAMVTLTMIGISLIAGAENWPLLLGSLGAGIPLFALFMWILAPVEATVVADPAPDDVKA